MYLTIIQVYFNGGKHVTLVEIDMKEKEEFIIILIRDILDHIMRLWSNNVLSSITSVGNVEPDQYLDG